MQEPKNSSGTAPKSTRNDIFFSKGFYFHTIKHRRYNYTDNRHGAPSHYFAYMRSGSCKIVTETETVYIKQGDIFYIPYKCSYQSYWYGDDMIEFVSLGFMYLPVFDGKTYSVQAVHRSDSPEAYDISLKLINEIVSSPRICAADIGRLYTVIGTLLPIMRHRMFCSSSEIVRRATEYLAENPYLKIPEAAKKCAVSEASLYKAFQKESDITPNTLKNNLLLERAKDMLISTDKSVEYISSHLGFSSASYFRKKFKLYFNATPNELRKGYKI